MRNEMQTQTQTQTPEQRAKQREYMREYMRMYRARPEYQDRLIQYRIQEARRYLTQMGFIITDDREARTQ